MLIALLAGCGSEAASVPDTLGYVPRDAHLVMLVPTDLEGDQWQRFGRLVAPALKGSEFDTVRKNIAASIPDVNFDEDLAPLLGDTLVVAAVGRPQNPHIIAILKTPDADKAEHLAEGVRNGYAIADGSTMVVELDGGNHELDAAMDRHKAGSGMSPEGFAKAFGDGADDDALVRVLDHGADLPGIESGALAFRLDDDAVHLHVRARSDNPQALAASLEALGRRGLHTVPGVGAKLGLVGDNLNFVDSDGRSSLKLARLGDPTADVHASGDVVEGDVTVPVPGGLD